MAKDGRMFFFEGHQRVACTRVSTIRFTDTSQPNGRLCAGCGRLFSRDEIERRMNGRSPVKQSSGGAL
jgi:hypothetical protein